MLELINPLFTTCLSVAGSDSKDAKIKKSLMAGYTSELLTQLIHYTENADFLQVHGQTLLALSESGKMWLLTALELINSLFTDGFYHLD